MHFYVIKNIYPIPAPSERSESMTNLLYMKGGGKWQNARAGTKTTQSSQFIKYFIFFYSLLNANNPRASGKQMETNKERWKNKEWLKKAERGF